MQNSLRYIYTVFTLFVSVITMAQETLVTAQADSLYREDQFYIGVTYNLSVDMPSGAIISGLTGGVQFGFLRDIPLNKQRNWAIAIGAGMSLDQFGQNLFIGETETDESIFRILDDNVSYSNNRFNMGQVEVPLEIRWRSSTASTYKFWRVYTGFRVGYTYWYKSTFKQSGNNVNQTKIPEFDPLRLSATLSLGYNTFNLFASYSINPFFENAETIDGEQVNFRALKVGLLFYIL